LKSISSFSIREPQFSHFLSPRPDKLIAPLTHAFSAVVSLAGGDADGTIEIVPVVGHISIFAIPIPWFCTARIDRSTSLCLNGSRFIGPLNRGMAVVPLSFNF
jgi:hypothetical protein